MKRFLAALLIALWSVPALGQLGPGGSSLGPSGGGSGGSVPAGSIAIGTTAITGGTTLRVLYDNGGFVGEYTNTQLTALINPATSSLTGSLPAFPGNTTTFFRGDGTYQTLNCAALSNAGTGCSAAAGITALTSDVTATGPGSAAATIANGAVTYAKTQNLGALAVMGRSANSSGVGADIQATAASDAILRESGSTLGFGTIATGGIANNAVTLAKLATQATNTVLGNATSGTAVPTALAVGTCSTTSSALIWTTNTGFGCNTSITASAIAVGGITGLGTGVATALAVNVGTTGAPLVKGTSVCADLSNGATGCSTATGTSGATLAVLNGNNTYSGTSVFSAGITTSSTVTMGNSIGNASGTNPLCWNSGTGAVTFATAACTASDARLKTNLAPLRGVLSKLMTLGAWRYDWKDPTYGTARQIGVLADDFESSFPELVNIDDAHLKAFDYQKFTAVLFEAIKEQQTQIDELKKKVH